MEIEKDNFLVVGKDGRAAAIIESLHKSKVRKNIYCIPGNAGTGKYAINIPEISVTDIDAIREFVKEKKIKYVIPSPESTIVLGISDALKGICDVFAPSKAASILEASKVYTKDLCYWLEVPTAKYQVFKGTKAVKDHLNSLKGQKNIWPLVIKLDGLEEGKGVTVCKSRSAANAFLRKIDKGKTFKNESNLIIVEECLIGREISFIVMVAPDGSKIIMPTAQDYKRAYDNDEGDNTGSMGAYSPAINFTASLKKKIMSRIVNPLLEVMNRLGMPFVGFFYVGLMICKGENPHLLEINVRMGDPEAEVILPRLKSDFGRLIIRAFNGGFKGIRVHWDKRKCVTTVRAPKGYPGKYKKGFAIRGIAEAEKIGAKVYLAGAKFSKKNIFTDGGRVAMVTGMGDTYEEARNISQHGASLIQWPGAWNRTDIAKVAVEWERRN